MSVEIIELIDGLESTSLKEMDRRKSMEGLKQGKLVFSLYSKLRDDILITYQKVTGKNFLSCCPNCGMDSIGRFVFCSSCSKDGNPHRLLNNCDAQKCWANNTFFNEHKETFQVDPDINYVSTQANSSPIDGSVVRTVGLCYF